MNQNSTRQDREVEHFTNLYSNTGHTWWGNTTKAGQRRNDRRIELLREHVDITPETRILEVGCGKGEYTRRLAKLGCPVTAFDITPILVETARENIPDSHVTLEVGDAMDPQYEDASFDVIFGKAILHHLDYQRAFNAYKRLLAPGGILFFTEPNLFNPLNFIAHNTPFLRKTLELSDDEIAFTRKQLVNSLKAAGYNQINVQYIDFMFPLIPDALIEPVDKLGRFLERIPVVKAMSGSLLLTASL